MNEEPREQKVYVPIRGMHIQPPPVWYAEPGLKLPPDTRLKKLARWMRRTVSPIFELDREERSFRCWRLLIYWLPKE